MWVWSFTAGTLSINERKINSLDQNQHPQIFLRRSSPPFLLLNSDTITCTISIPLPFMKNLNIHLSTSLSRSCFPKSPTPNTYSLILHAHWDSLSSFHLCTPPPTKQLTSTAPLMSRLFRFTSSFLLSRSPLCWAAWSAPLFVSLPVGVNNLTTELLQSWHPSRPQIGTVCLFMTLCGSAHVWDVHEWEGRVCARVSMRACVSPLDFSQYQISCQSLKTVV